MPREPKLRRDVNEVAYDTVQAILGNQTKPLPPGEGRPNPEAVKRGRKGGKKGGKARAKGLTARQRKAIARKAARARWGGRPKT